MLCFCKLSILLNFPFDSNGFFNEFISIYKIHIVSIFSSYIFPFFVILAYPDGWALQYTVERNF